MVSPSASAVFMTESATGFAAAADVEIDLTTALDGVAPAGQREPSHRTDHRAGLRGRPAMAKRSRGSRERAIHRIGEQRSAQGRLKVFYEIHSNHKPLLANSIEVSTLSLSALPHRPPGSSMSTVLRR